MSADKRNTSVVIALIASMTVGAVVLRALEPGKLNFEGSALLMAERGTRVEEVQIEYVAPGDEGRSPAVGADESLWRIDTDGAVYAEPLQSRVRLVVKGDPGANGPGKEQKKTIISVLGSISQASNVDVVPVRLLADSQAGELRELLERKGIIR